MKKLLCVVTAGIIFGNNTAFAITDLGGLTPILPGGGWTDPCR